MSTFLPRRATTLAALVAGGAVLIAGWWGAKLLATHTPAQFRTPDGMLLAPMVSVVDPCILLPTQSTRSGDARADSLTHSCTGPEGSAAQLVESTLTTLQPVAARQSAALLGYTLPAPLLQLFRREGRDWVIDAERVQRIVRTIRDTNRPVILYLFSTHFSTDAPLEIELAKDPSNLAQTRDGPMPQSRYYDSAINNWTFADTQTNITARRTQAVQALLTELCRLPDHDLVKIKGVSLLGELHHLFPDFEAGMGFDLPYRTTDYSPTSVKGFRDFLKGEFRRIEHLNRVLASDYRSFDDVQPPSRDIRSEPLQRYTEHIDSFAHGTLPVSGWAFVDSHKGSAPAWVHVYLNGTFVQKTLADKGRQDVLLAKPEFGSANTGWRLDLDFRRLQPGLHRIDVFLESSPGQLSALGAREISVMDKHQKTPLLVPQQPLPQHSPFSESVQAHIDQPRGQASYYYNPLVPFWHSFRAKQVVDYLRFFDNLVSQSCLSTTPHYTHQIIPFANPSWDENKFAIRSSLKVLDTQNIQLGVSLYGDASYGTSFAKWYSSTAHRNYGVTEFHPLKGMSGKELSRALDLHARRGASFLSFFVEPYWNNQIVDRGHNIFSFDPNNSKFGSDHLYKAMQIHLAEPKKYR
ncbi:MAG: hypothetical protein KKB95_20945 [Gammaproteobacteria bacterium]|nr:hypothetical protein [Gammaproteobacteria bacterium]MBU1507017.1 hypothetical protein [Gammaproteobacteria bacterium]MBU2121781.1 hypothetical protein [Gammaproteobacteria bacterium]MBU2172800.1 hypothetical protein [Gammaproteobacteria bacterium]MBU2200696.1 hypothetical protein [Gammaproteobacteria bacterium]